MYTVLMKDRTNPYKDDLFLYAIDEIGGKPGHSAYDYILWEDLKHLVVVDDLLLDWEEFLEPYHKKAKGSEHLTFCFWPEDYLLRCWEMLNWWACNKEACKEARQLLKSWTPPRGSFGIDLTFRKSEWKVSPFFQKYFGFKNLLGGFEVPPWALEEMQENEYHYFIVKSFTTPLTDRDSQEENLRIQAEMKLLLAELLGPFCGLPYHIDCDTRTLWDCREYTVLIYMSF